MSPLLSEFSNDITLNENLFKRVKAVYDQKETLKLTTEQNTLLDKKYKILRLTYSVFMVGIIVSVISFALAFQYSSGKV